MPLPDSVLSSAVSPAVHRRMLNPGTIMLVVANLLPLAGIAFWGWDAFLLLMLYWMETAIIAFWALARLAVTPNLVSAAKPYAAAAGVLQRAAMVAFFSVHAGIFMAVHFMFLWLLFSGAWRERVQGIGDFVSQIVVGPGLWIPLVLLWIGGGAMFVYTALQPRWLIGRVTRLGVAPPPPPADGGSRAVLSALYTRIIIMQVTLIAGAWVSFALQGSLAPFVILIIARTAVDLFWSGPYEHNPSPAVAR